MTEAHLRDCASCRKANDEIQFGARLVGLLAESKAPDSMWRDIQGARPERQAFFGPAIGPIVRPLVLGAALAAALVMGVFLRAHVPGDVSSTSSSTTSISWEVTNVRGVPLIGNLRVMDIGHLHPGDSLQTNANSEAEVKIADIGQLDLDPNSRIRLISTNSNQHRIALERGKMTARTWSPPRLFVVETPSSTAIDLGCIYSCEVRRDGSTLLHVTLGLVALDFHGREIIVPAGAFCRTRPGAGTGTPYFDDSSDRLQAALNDVDFGKNDDERARQLEIVLKEARPRDTLTLWYLIPRLSGAMRNAVIDRATRLVPLPNDATRSGIAALNATMMDSWKNQLEKAW